MCPSTETRKSTEPDLIMYDLITGKTNKTRLSFEGPAVNCSNEKNLFVISIPKENSVKKVFYIATFHIFNNKEFHSIKKTIDFGLMEQNEKLCIQFSHVFDDNIFVFYRIKCRDLKLDKDKNYMMIVCGKTMRI